MATLHEIDYILVTLTIVASVATGIYYGLFSHKNKTADDFLIASHKTRSLPVALSTVVSYLSGVSLLSHCTEIYYFGSEFCFIILSYSLCLLLVYFLYVPLLHPLKITSVQQYLDRRFRSSVLVYLSTVQQCIGYCGLNGLTMFSGAIVLESMTGLPFWISILLTGAVSIVCTSLGGYRAVIWADVLQAVIIIFSLILINILGTIYAGGPQVIWNTLQHNNRFHFNWSPSPVVRSTVWNFGVVFIPGQLQMVGLSSVAVQRYCSLPTLRDAKNSILMAITVAALIKALMFSTGFISFAYFALKGCDPLTSGQIKNPNQILPYFVLDTIQFPAVPGCFISMIICGTLSNLSSSCNIVSAIIWEDILKKQLTKSDISEKKKTKITRILSICAGIVSIFCGFLMSAFHGSLNQIAHNVVFVWFSPLLVYVTVGAISNRTSWKIAMIAGAVTLISNMWIGLGSNFAGNSKPMLEMADSNCTLDMIHDLKNVSFSYANYSSSFDNQQLSTTSYFHNNSIVLPSYSGIQGNTTLKNRTITEVDSSNNHDVFILYRLSYTAILPFCLILAAILTAILSFVPGLKNEENVPKELLFSICTNYQNKKPKHGSQELSELNLPLAT